MQQLARLGCALTIVWATDGEASHPGSTVFSGEQLAALRRRESQRALARLGVTPASTVHLGLADGALSHHRDALRRRLRDIVGPGDVLLAPWECDGHPDHEIAGAVALEISAATWRYPIWMWHWAEPGDGRVPWQRIRASRVPDVDRKTEAIGEFASQVRPIGPGPADSAILPPDVVARFLRDNEWIIT
jgi:LmbE family N-acetylglucosaminyl deacetylase